MWWIVDFWIHFVGLCMFISSIFRLLRYSFFSVYACTVIVNCNPLCILTLSCTRSKNMNYYQYLVYYLFMEVYTIFWLFCLWCAKVVLNHFFYSCIVFLSHGKQFFAQVCGLWTFKNVIHVPSDLSYKFCQLVLIQNYLFLPVFVHKYKSFTDIEALNEKWDVCQLNHFLSTLNLQCFCAKLALHRP